MKNKKKGILIAVAVAVIVVIACIFCAFGLYLKQNSEYKRDTKFDVTPKS